MNENREWMYKRRLLRDGTLCREFLAGVEYFIQVASSKPNFMDGSKIKCPCMKCDNIPYQTTNIVKLHLVKNGFVLDYQIWRFQGEESIPIVEEMNMNTDEGSSTYHTMVRDYVESQFYNIEAEEPPNREAQQLYDMLTAADKDLWPGCKKHSQLSFVARIMNLKAEYHMSERCFDKWIELIKEIVPEDDLVPPNFYHTKKLLRGMGLPLEKIDCCPANCMIYWVEDSVLVQCKFCNATRYKESRSNGKKQVAAKKMYYLPLTPRLQRMYASKATAEDMCWHASSSDNEAMHHPSDSPAWKHLDSSFPDFAAEIRNVRLGLCIDGFQPYAQSGQQYSSWLVIVTPYNLPHWLCMKEQYMFLTILVPGPRNPKEKLDVFLQPLIAELKHLWDVGVTTYDVSLKQNFQMRAVLLWTISDFPAYSMLSGWSTAGRLACPHCMENSGAFTLARSGKQSWFDNHRKFLPLDHVFRTNKKDFRKNTMMTDVLPPEPKSGEEILAEIEQMGFVKVTELGSDDINREVARNFGTGWKKRSIFWDLPYWKSLLIRHNFDVMHIEKNVFDNVFNTVMNVQGKTKDTPKSREELNMYCSRPGLARNDSKGKYPKASYTLGNAEKKVLCEWVGSLKFPDGYVSNITRCVEMKKLKLQNMKSHDCHVFMQRLLPIALCELLPQSVWQAITELSLFFKDLTSRTISFEDMEKLNDSIPVTLCKLERIFPPSFFDIMEHLPIHLADEARTAGPVQYRWMYPFERYLKKLKDNVRNKARVEGSISNAYLVEEASTFCSYYFEDHVTSKYNSVPRNYDGGEDVRNDGHPDRLSIFKQPGEFLGKSSTRYLDDKEYNTARTYVLLYCAEVGTYQNLFVEQLQALHPNISDNDIEKNMEEGFALWFESYRRFEWDPSEESVIYDNFMEKAARRYRDFVNTLKKGKDNPKKGRPPFIPADMWPNWLHYWDSEEVETISQKAKKSRMSEPLGPGTGIVKHKGSSKSTIKYAAELAKERGCEMQDCMFEAYEILHVNKDGSHTDKKSAEIGKAVEARAEQLRQEGVEDVNMNDVYLEVVGIDKRKRTFGIGLLGTGRVRGQTSSGATQFHSQESCDGRFKDIEKQLQDERDERQRQVEEEREERQRMREEMQHQQRLINQLISQSMDTTDPSPS